MLCTQIDTTKFTILTILIVQLHDIKYIYSVVQPSPLFISKTFSSSQTETLFPLNIKSLFPPPPIPQQPPFYFVPMNLTILGTSYDWNDSICPFVPALFYW